MYEYANEISNDYRILSLSFLYGNAKILSHMIENIRQGLHIHLESEILAGEENPAVSHRDSGKDNAFIPRLPDGRGLLLDEPDVFNDSLCEWAELVSPMLGKTDFFDENKTNPDECIKQIKEESGNYLACFQAFLNHGGVISELALNRMKIHLPDDDELRKAMELHVAYLSQDKLNAKLAKERLSWHI